jgi:hypothetical protein
MSEFLDLTPETLAEVISYLDTEEWTALWLCGDLKMQWKLGKGKAVREMAISWMETSKCLWPSQIKYLDGLQSFSYYRPFRLHTERFSGLHLSKLSPNLKKLVLNCKSSLEALDQLLSVDPDHFQALETLYLSNSLHDRRVDFVIPKTVTDLRISVQSSLCLPLSVLPPNLIKLYCLVGSLEVGSSRFPETLQSIELRLIKTADPKFLDTLPLGVRHLHISHRGSAFNYDAEAWTSLSKLTNLKVLEFSPIYFDLAEARLLPRFLEELTLLFFHPSWSDEILIQLFEALPPNLTRLGGMLAPDMSPTIAQKLPRYLHSFDVSVQYGSVSYLPDSMTALEIVGEYSSVSAMVDFSIPTKIRTLQLHTWDESLIEKLPIGLQELWVDIGDSLLTLDGVSKLPRNMTSFWINGSRINPIGDTGLTFKALPPTLTLLEAFQDGSVVWTSIPSDSSLYLPRGMKTLKMGCLDFSGCNMAQWVLGLPNRLVTLKLMIMELQRGVFTSLGMLSCLNSLTIEVLNSPEGGWSQYLDFKSLPPSLSFLTLEACDDFEESDISNDTFLGAPRSLIELSIPFSPLITKECLARLPKDCILSVGGQSL